MTHPRDQWWVINGGDILSAMQRAHAGENPDLLYVELVANSESDEESDQEDDDA